MEKLVYQAILVPEGDGGYSVEFPDLPGCVTCGDTVSEALHMALDAAKTYVASLMLRHEEIPGASERDVPEGCRCAYVAFEADASYIVQGEVVSAAQAARELGVSASRITHMLASGMLDGYRRGRSTFITAESLELRKAQRRSAGRPRKIALGVR